MNNYITNKLAAFCVLLLSLAFGQVAAHADYLDPRFDWSWTTHDWTGNDKPYVKIRETYGQLFRAKKINQADLKRLKKVSQAAPKDDLARFKWAYYGYCAALLAPKRTTGSGMLYQVPQALNAAPDDSYQNARLRFLVYTYIYQRNAKLRAVGKRLLRRDPNDITVKYEEVTHLNNSEDAKDAALALKYAKELVKAQPKNPAMYSTLAFVYESRWREERKKTDADAAITNYRRFIKLSDLTKTQLKQTENRILNIQRGTARK